MNTQFAFSALIPGEVPTVFPAFPPSVQLRTRWKWYVTVLYYDEGGRVLRGLVKYFPDSKGCEVQTANPCTGIQQTASLSDA